MKHLVLLFPLSLLLTACYPFTYAPAGGYNPYANPAAHNSQGTPTTPGITTRPTEVPAPTTRPSSNTSVPKPPTPDRLNSLNNKPQSSSSPASQAKPTYPFAKAIPGQKGFVLNPYTGNKVDVTGLSRGILVRDPHDNNPDHKFRVP